MPRTRQEGFLSGPGILGDLRGEGGDWGGDKEIAKAVLSELWFDSKCPNRRLHSR